MPHTLMCTLVTKNLRSKGSGCNIVEQRQCLAAAKNPSPKDRQHEGIVRAGDTKAQHRAEIYLNIRSSLSMACALPVVHEIACPEMICGTSDDLAFLAHKWNINGGKRRLITTQEAVDFIETVQLSAFELQKKREELKHQRLAQVSLTLDDRGSWVITMSHHQALWLRFSYRAKVLQGHSR